MSNGNEFFLEFGNQATAISIAIAEEGLNQHENIHGTCPRHPLERHISKLLVQLLG